MESEEAKAKYNGQKFKNINREEKKYCEMTEEHTE